jgi:hypothetical protein
MIKIVLINTIIKVEENNHSATIKEVNKKSINAEHVRGSNIFTKIYLKCFGQINFFFFSKSQSVPTVLAQLAFAHQNIVHKCPSLYTVTAALTRLIPIKIEGEWAGGQM